MARRNTAQPTCPSCAGFLASSGVCARCARNTAQASFSASAEPVAAPSSPAPSDQPPSPTSSPSGPSSRTSSWSTSPTIVVEPVSDAPIAPQEEASEQVYDTRLDTAQSAL